MSDKLEDIMYGNMIMGDARDEVYVFKSFEDAERDAKLFISEFSSNNRTKISVVKVIPIKYFSRIDKEELHEIENREETLERKLEPNL